MTTSQSPIAQLREQAVNIAAVLKRAEQGEFPDCSQMAKFVKARGNPSVAVGIVQDDKVIRIEFFWDKIRDTDEAGLVEYILGYMSGGVTPGTVLS